MSETNAWRHSICEECWDERFPDRGAHVAVDADFELCCFCRELTRAGIYVRWDPKDPALLCKGDHNG